MSNGTGSRSIQTEVRKRRRFTTALFTTFGNVASKHLLCRRRKVLGGLENVASNIASFTMIGPSSSRMTRRTRSIRLMEITLAGLMSRIRSTGRLAIMFSSASKDALGRVVDAFTFRKTVAVAKSSETYSSIATWQLRWATRHLVIPPCRQLIAWPETISCPNVRRQESWPVILKTVGLKEIPFTIRLPDRSDRSGFSSKMTG